MTKVIIKIQLDKTLPYFLKDGVLTLEREYDIDLSKHNHKLVHNIDPQGHSGVSVYIEKEKPDAA